MTFLRNAGVFNRLVSIETQGTPVSDGAGGYTREWQVVAENVWMRKMPVSAQRVLEWGKVDFPMAVQFQMYYREDIIVDTLCRLREGDTFYTIHSVENVNDAAMLLEILAYTS